MLPLQLLDAVGQLLAIRLPASLADLLQGRSNAEIVGYDVCAGAAAAAARNAVHPFSLVFGEDAALDDDEREAKRLAFVLSRRLLPVAASRDSLLCIDGTDRYDPAALPVRLYEPEYFCEGNPDLIGWTESTGAKLGPTVASSFAALIALSECARGTPDDAWGRLGKLFAGIDPAGAGTDAGREFWEKRVRLHARRTSEPRRWRRLVSVLGAGVDVQLALYPMAQHALTGRHFELALAIAQELTTPELRVQGRIVRAKALAALSRDAENEQEVLSLARAWLAPAVPLSPNQLIDRAEMLDLLRPFRSFAARLLRLRVRVQPAPTVVM